MKNPGPALTLEATESSVIAEDELAPMKDTQRTSIRGATCWLNARPQFEVVLLKYLGRSSLAFNATPCKMVRGRSLFKHASKH